MEKDRLAAFMDAVLAIIMTILVLELPRPAEVSFAAMWDLRGSYFCYALSFFWLGIMWVNLHNEWHQVQVISKAVVWWGLALLFTSSWIPYSINVVNMDVTNKAGQLMYGVSVLLVTGANIGLSEALWRCHEGLCRADLHAIRTYRFEKFMPDILIKLVGMGLSATLFPMAMSFAVLIAAVWMLIPWPEHPDLLK